MMERPTPPDRPAGRRPPGFVHVDLDGLWTLAGCYGYEEGSSFERDPIFEFALPRLLDLFDRLSIRATFFIVGRDLELETKRRAVTEIFKRGHELGNHSYSHWLGLEGLPYDEIKQEIATTQAALMQLTGVAPLGFRAPGYNAGVMTLSACQEAGLIYDGSLLPTRWAPLFRFLVRRLRRRLAEGPAAKTHSEADRRRQAQLEFDAQEQYGSGGGGRAALAPQWVRPDPALRPILRLPLAVSPVFRFPLHASLGMLMGESSVRSGLGSLAAQGWPMTYLVHGIDAAAPEEFIDQLPGALGRSRGFNAPLSQRTAFLSNVLDEFRSLTEVQPTVNYLNQRERAEIAEAAPAQMPRPKGEASDPPQPLSS